MVHPTPCLPPPNSGPLLLLPPPVLIPPPTLVLCSPCPHPTLWFLLPCPSSFLALYSPPHPCLPIWLLLPLLQLLSPAPLTPTLAPCSSPLTPYSSTPSPAPRHPPPNGQGLPPSTPLFPIWPMLSPPRMFIWMFVSMFNLTSHEFTQK